MKWIINRENFTGNAQSAVYTDKHGVERVAYTPHTLDEYLAKHPGAEVIPEDEFFKMVDAYHLTLCTPWKACTEAHYWEMLEVLPPERFSHYKGAELFHVCERITGNLVNWYMNKGSRFFCRVQFDSLPLSELVKGGINP